MQLGLRLGRTVWRFVSLDVVIWWIVVHGTYSFRYALKAGSTPGPGAYWESSTACARPRRHALMSIETDFIFANDELMLCLMESVSRGLSLTTKSRTYLDVSKDIRLARVSMAF